MNVFENFTSFFTAVSSRPSLYTKVSIIFIIYLQFSRFPTPQFSFLIAQTILRDVSPIHTLH